MALAIDTRALTRSVPQGLQEYLQYVPGDTSRFEIYRVSVHATVFHDAPPLSAVRSQVVARREVLDWQADHNEDLDEVQVLHILKEHAETAPWLAAAFTQTECTNATTPLVASCAFQSPSLIANTQQRLLSSYQRYFFRYSLLSDSNTDLSPCSLTSDTNTDLSPCALTADTNTDLSPYSLTADTNTDFSWRVRLAVLSSCSSQRSISDLPGASRWWPLTNELRINGIVSSRNKPWYAWHVQYDIVDLLSQRSTPTGRHKKRGRSILYSIRGVSSSPPVEDTPPGNHLPEAKRFNGVRYRPDRRTWTAEMKPPKYKNKVSFGEYKSQTQAARVVDVAYYYFDKPDYINFPDTPHMLSRKPLPVELDVKEKLRFVKEHAKWVSSIASTLPSSPAFVTSAIPHQSFRGGQACNFMFGSNSEVASFLSCGDADIADDGISQPQPSLQLDSMVSNGLMEPNLSNGLMQPNLVTADAGGFDSGTLQEQQGPLQWSSEGGFADPCLPNWWSPSSSVHITEGWDGAEHSSAQALTNLVTPSQPSCEWMDSLLMSSPANVTPMPPSPSNF